MEKDRSKDFGRGELFAACFAIGLPSAFAIHIVTLYFKDPSIWNHFMMAGEVVGTIASLGMTYSQVEHNGYNMQNDFSKDE